MRKILVIFVITSIVLSCQKEQPKSQAEAIFNKLLQDSLSATDFERLQRDNILTYSVGEDHYIKIPLAGKIPGEFVLLKMSAEGRFRQGRIIRLTGQRTTAPGRAQWDGQLAVYSMGSELLWQSEIKNGYLHNPRRGGRVADIVPVYPSGDFLPVVVVTAYVSNGGISYADWMWLESFFWTDYTAMYDYGGWYGSMDGSSGGIYDGGGSTGGSTYGGQSAPVISVDYEYQADRAGIDLQQYINCFNQVPDAGATCSIEIFADVPVDAEPGLLFDYSSGSPGHTFLQIKKSNGSQSVLQNIGFYPATKLKALLTDAPIPSKFVDNSQHEFNASFKMSLTPPQLNSILTELLYLKDRAYDIDNYNCTDLALAVFNKVRTDEIQIPLLNIPGLPGGGTSTPQGLWSRLNQMKNSGHPEAANIFVSKNKNFVANSSGPCN